MLLSFEKFVESGFNHDLTGNLFDLVLFGRYHVGLDVCRRFVSITLQGAHVTTFWTLWFRKSEAGDYFAFQKNSATYKYTAFGL